MNRYFFITNSEHKLEKKEKIDTCEDELEKN